MDGANVLTGASGAQKCAAGKITPMIGTLTLF